MRQIAELKTILSGDPIKGVKEFDRIVETDNRHYYVTSVGSNRCFNLGLISDGSPVAEPHLVDLNNVSEMKMSNQHTVFLTHDNLVYGCGKSSAFLPDQKNEGYQAEPMQIQIPNKPPREWINRIKVSDGGTQFLIGDKWYFIGKVPPDIRNLKRIAANCQVSTWNSIVKMDTPRYQTTNVMLNGRPVTIYLRRNPRILEWDRIPQFQAPKTVNFLLNGMEEPTLCDSFQVLADGIIYIEINGILKGKLELWKNADDGFQVKSGTEEHFDTKYSLIALLEEVPGTVEISSFKLSPDGQNMIMKRGGGWGDGVERVENRLRAINRKKSKLMTAFLTGSQQIHRIIERRAREEMDPVDIPMDTTLLLSSGVRDVMRFEMNRTLFELVYPGCAEEMGENTIVVRQLNDSIPLQFGGSHPMIFVPDGTPPQNILHLITTDGERIQCHKYLHLLHSRQINALQRFESSRVYGSYGVMEGEKPMELNAMATGNTVRNALRGMLYLKNLNGLKTIELIECINYYDYHMMDEMFRDSMRILFENITEFTVSLLFLLYESFPEPIINGLVERPGLVFYSREKPSKELLVHFAKKLGVYSPAPKPALDYQPLKFYDPESVIKSLVNLDEDSEDVVWNSLRSEMNNNLSEWHYEAMKRKQVVEKRRKRLSSNIALMKKQFATPSSPIPIGGSAPRKTETPSPSSIQSPSFSSPLSTSKPRPPSISIDDFPEMGSPSTSAPKPKYFVPKGAKFKKDFDILKTPSPSNPWKIGETSSGVNFDEVVRDEQKLQKNIKTGNKKVEMLAHVETEQLAAIEILREFKGNYGDEALIGVELVYQDAPTEQMQWGNMPGLVRR
uniref:Cellobiose phosphorylase n=1 Tax=Caenorhabditis tropicalis TaxID=1561998 RepID=A0A1I7THM7_9PELO